MSKKLKNDEAWEQFFAHENITPHQNMHLVCSANILKKYREPRLMAKIDHKTHLPKIFAENHIGILPISRGDYFIGCFDNYHELESAGGVIHHMPLPEHLQSLDAEIITSEATALNCAVASGIIADFLQETLLYPTVFGRMGSGCFDFKVGSSKQQIEHRIAVQHAHIEIDAAYEGIESLAIFEAKLSEDSDFLIRQLYYPFRLWKNRITKKVRPIFLGYSNGIYVLREYIFANIDSYNSIEPVKIARYSIEDACIEINEIEKILRKTTVQPEPKNIPFPQADSFERVINLCEILKNTTLNKFDIAQEYDFELRQSGYYGNAAIYLGLIEKSKNHYQITQSGDKILRMKYKERQLAFCACIFSHEIFNQLMRQYLTTGQIPDKKSIASLIEHRRPEIKSYETLHRRAETVISWLRWIARLANA